MTQSVRKILVLFAHPTQRRSEVNLPLIQATRKLESVTVVDLYASYPTMEINIDVEQKRLLAHDVVIFLAPLYWYSTPAILKEWQDLVLEYGFAYGHEGTALRGKIFFLAITTGGNEAAYQAAGYNHFTIRQLLYPLEQTATLCGMRYLPPFVLHGARSAREDGRVKGHVDKWRQLLERLREGTLDIELAANADTLNAALPAGKGRG